MAQPPFLKKIIFRFLFRLDQLTDKIYQYLVQCNKISQIILSNQNCMPYTAVR